MSPLRGFTDEPIWVPKANALGYPISPLRGYRECDPGTASQRGAGGLAGVLEWLVLLDSGCAGSNPRDRHTNS